MIALNPSVFAVSASTEAAAYSRTNGRPISSPISAIRNSPRLLSGCSHRSSTSLGTTYAASTRTANTTRLPISRVCDRLLAEPQQDLDEHVMAKAMVTAGVKGTFPTSTQ